MAMTLQQLSDVRASLYVTKTDASQGVGKQINDALIAGQAAALKYDAPAIAMLKEIRRHPAVLAGARVYMDALDALGSTLGVDLNAGPLTPAPETPAPVSPPAPSPSVQTGEVLPGIFLNEYGQLGIGRMPLLDPRTKLPFLNYGLWIFNLNENVGAGIAYVVDQPNGEPQRPGVALRRVGVDSVSRDGGRRRGANALYADAGGVPAYIADGERPVYTDGCDSMLDNLSLNAEPVEADPDRQGFFRMVPLRNALGNLRRSGQRAVFYLLGRWGVPGVFLAGMNKGDPIRILESRADHNAADTDTIGQLQVEVVRLQQRLNAAGVP